MYRIDHYGYPVRRGSRDWSSSEPEQSRPPIRDHWEAVPISAPRFPQTYCSQCGQAFGPGNHGYSHCQHHAHLTPVDDD